MKPEIVVRIAPPRRAAGAAGYLCAFEFAGQGERQVRYAAAPNPAQSIELALRMISATLDGQGLAWPVEIVWNQDRHRGARTLRCRVESPNSRSRPGISRREGR
jgi:hypothetical protein